MLELMLWCNVICEVTHDYCFKVILMKYNEITYWNKKGLYLKCSEITVVSIETQVKYKYLYCTHKNST